MAITAEELRVLISAQDNASDTLGGLANVMEGVGQSALGMGDNVFAGVSKAQMALMGIGAIAAVGLGFSIYQAAQFEKEMAIVSATSGVTGAELDALGEKAKKLGEKYATSSTEAAQGLQTLGRAGVESAVQLGVLEEAMKMTTLEEGLDTDTASEQLVNLVKMYGDSLDNVSKYSDALIQGSMMSTVSISGLMEAMKFAGGDAKTLGWSLENLIATFATLGEQGIDPMMMGTTMRGVLGMLIKETPKADEALSGIGLTFDDFKDSAGNVKQPLETVMTLYDAMYAKFGSVKTAGQEWAQALNQIFPGAVGGKAVRLFTGIEDGHGILEKYTGLMNEGFDSTEAVNRAMDSTPVVAQKLWVSFQNLMIAVGDGFLPILKLLLGGLTELTEFLEGNEIAVYAIAGALTILAGAALLVAAAWGKNLVIQTVDTAYGILKSTITAVIGEKTIETAALAENTAAWELNNIARNAGVNLPGGGLPGTGVGQITYGPRQGGYLQGLKAAGSSFLGSLGSIEALGMSIPIMIPVLAGVAAAAAGVFLWFSHLDGIYKKVGEKVEALRGDEKRLTDRLHEQREALKGVKEGTKAYDDLNAALKITQAELDKVIEKIYQQNQLMYQAESMDPRKMLSAEGGSTESLMLQQAGSGPFGAGVGVAQWLVGANLGYSSNVVGAQADYLESYKKWATPTFEHQLQGAYKYMGSEENLALLQKQADNPLTLTDADRANIEQIDNHIASIVGRDNVQGAKDMYFAELKLQKAREKLDEAMGRMWMSIMDLILAFFGVRSESDDTSGSSQNLSSKMSETADKIEKATEKVYNLIDAINKFIDNVQWWVDELSNKHPDTAQETQARNVMNTGQTLANPSTNILGIPNIPLPDMNPYDNIQTNSPLVVKRGSPGNLQKGTTEVRLPDIDPDRFAQERAETKKALLSKNGNNYTIICYANTKEDAKPIAQAVREEIKKLKK